MDGVRSKTDEERSLLASAHELQRAAGNVLKDAGGGWSVPMLAITLAHVEEALDRLSVGMLQLERAVAIAGGRGSGSDHSDLRPEARALCFHLRMVAERLRGSEDACQASRMWTRRILESESATASDAGALAAAAPISASR